MELDGRVAFAKRSAHVVRDELGVAVLQKARVAGDGRRRSGSAEKLPEGHTGPLRGEVPECDVNRGNPEHGDSVAAEEVQRLLQLPRHRRDVGRVAADQDRRHRRIDHRLHRRHAVVAERLSPADRPVVGLDPHQEDVERLPRLTAPGRRWPAVLVRNREGNRVDASNLHAHILEQTALRSVGRVRESWARTAARHPREPG